MNPEQGLNVDLEKLAALATELAALVADFAAPALEQLAVLAAELAAPALTDADLEQFAALADAATPGPWHWCERTETIVAGSTPVIYTECSVDRNGDINGGILEINPADTDFIVALRTAVPYLVVELKTARRRIAVLEVEQQRRVLRDVLDTAQMIMSKGGGE